MFFSPIFILDFHLFKVWHEHLGEVDVRVTHLLDPRMESLRRASCILDLLLMKRLIRNTNQPPLSCPPQGSSGVCPSCSDYLQAAFTFMSKPFNGSNAVRKHFSTLWWHFWTAQGPPAKCSTSESWLKEAFEKRKSLLILQQQWEEKHKQEQEHRKAMHYAAIPM